MVQECTSNPLNSRLQLQPVTWLQKIALYVTKSRYYLVGSNNTQTAFKTLKIDRTDNELNIIDDRIEYSLHEMRDLLLRIDHGNKTSAKSSGVTKNISAFGLLGFVRFLNGYYLILIIKRRKVATIGYHSIYKIEDTRMIYIPNFPPSEYTGEEARYVKTFNNIDLTSNFYFSYSYDLSHTIQFNLASISRRFLIELSKSAKEMDELKFALDDLAENQNNPMLVKTRPNYRFIWNSRLIDVEGLHSDWKIYLIHGFVGQANICVYSKPLYITLIARRSQKYSGTRFLKRGLNCDGDVANEVETEQIVHDASLSSFDKSYYTSFVQVRGSIPDRWSQDVSKMVPKPPINRDFIDPYCHAAGKHFNDLMKRYGTPIVVLNLIKRKEKKPHESLLHPMLHETIEYLNQFIPPQHMIRHIGFDMARCNKSKDANVMLRLGKIGFNIVRVTGIYQSWKSAKKTNNFDNNYSLQLRQRTFNRAPSSSQIGGYRLSNGQCLQNGIVRVNCVDSLDRTNTAQFVLGKVALAFQLQALGVLIEPILEYDTDAVRLLEQLYEDHGDTIALQYGGSQLVHRIRTYRKIAPISSQSGEIMQTLSRYYSNTFSDAEKQNAINLLLGFYQPLPSPRKHLWNLTTDYYLHNKAMSKPFNLADRDRPYTQWWDRKVLDCLPRAYDEVHKDKYCYLVSTSRNLMSESERRDFYEEAYRCFEFTVWGGLLSFKMLCTIKDFMPNFSTQFSPFCIRLRPGPHKERYFHSPTSGTLPPNPSICISSTSSSPSELSLDSDQEGSDFDNLSSYPRLLSDRNTTSRLYRIRQDTVIFTESSCKTTTPAEAYGEIITGPDLDDITLYHKYVRLGSYSDYYKRSNLNESSPTLNDTQHHRQIVDFDFFYPSNISKGYTKPFKYESIAPSDINSFNEYVSYVI